jgi:hypothetical protein
MLCRLHHQECIKRTIVIGLQALEDKIAVLVVEPPSACVINRRFQKNRFSALLPKPLLYLRKQFAADVLALSMRSHVYRYDMAQLARLTATDNKTDDFI